jgi:predicted ester cyclase
VTAMSDAQVETPAEQAQRTEQRVRELFDGLLTQKDLSDPSRYWTDDAVDTFVALGFDLSGPEALAGYFRELFASMPDWRIEIERVVASGREAVVLWTAFGTFDGKPWRGLQPTGRAVRIAVVDAVELSDDGRVRRNVVHWDGLEMMRQLGLMPPRDSRRERLLMATMNGLTRLRRAVRRALRRG